MRLSSSHGIADENRAFSQEEGFRGGFRMMRLKYFPENDLTNSCADDGKKDGSFLNNRLGSD